VLGREAKSDGRGERRREKRKGWLEARSNEEGYIAWLGACWNHNLALAWWFYNNIPGRACRFSCGTKVLVRTDIDD